MKTENQHQEELFQWAKDLFEKETALSEIEKQLFEKTSDEQFIVALIRKFKKDQEAARSKRGLTKLIIGSVLLLLGFVITCINFHAGQSFMMIMYGTSTIGIVLVFWGLYEIVG